MRELPPAQLTALLTQLGLATVRELAGVEAHVYRMAGDLPRFESVWVDALRQARILTHFQAGQIHAGHGPSLTVGRYVLCHPVRECGFAAIYRAQDRETREVVRLAVIPVALPEQPALIERLEKLRAVGKGLPRQLGILGVGLDGSNAWAASPWIEGTSLADWMLHHGRFPAADVLEVARALLGELQVLETAGLIHGDICLQNILISGGGEIYLPQPGLRGAIGPKESPAQQLPPEAVSTLAPERVTHGSPPTVAGDLFACGCVWWHMLCGRSPLGGGDTLARLRAAQAASFGDLRQWAAHVPDQLAAAIRDCLQKDPKQRPKSMAELSERLGPLRRQGRQAIVRCMTAAARPRAPWLQSRRDRSKRRSHPQLLTAATLAALVVVAIAWPLWVARNRLHASTVVTQRDNPSKEQAGQISAAARISHVEPAKSRTNSNRTITDPAVILAGHSEETAGPEIRLPGDRLVRGETLQLKSGQRVCPQSGRARIVMPREGLAIAEDRVSFENIDFIAADRTSPSTGGENRSAALIRLLTAGCTFVNCSFQSANGCPELSAAIVWGNAAANEGNAAGDAKRLFQPAPGLDLPSGRIRMRDCVFRRLRTGIESQFRGAVVLDLENCLCLGPGPMISLAHAPAADEPVEIHLSHVTLREAEGLLDCRSTGPDDRSGEIGIEAAGCVLAPSRQAALMTITTDRFPRQLLAGVKWSGQGSVVAGQVVFGRWSQPGGAVQTIDDSTISIAGLVRGEVEFAGRFDGQPASSHVVNCQAPLQDSDFAGAAVRNLPPEIKPQP